MERKVLNSIKEVHDSLFRYTCVPNANLPRITPVQLKILNHIINSEEKVYQKDLEKILNVRRATVSDILNTMEKNNLIQRLPSVKDKRIKQIVLSESAENIRREATKKFEQLEKVMTKGVTKEKLDIYFEVCDLIKANLGKENIYC